MEDDTVQWIVVGVCGGLLLVLLVLLVVLPYWMWKRGHIFIMKIVYHFKSFEDDGVCYNQWINCRIFTTKSYSISRHRSTYSYYIVTTKCTKMALFKKAFVHYAYSSI